MDASPRGVLSFEDGNGNIPRGRFSGSFVGLPAGPHPDSHYSSTLSRTTGEGCEQGPAVWGGAGAAAADAMNRR
jgi:hypothetical protein